jgi:DNA-binding transcriptional LysR family regulator
MHFTIHQLEILLKVIENKSITKASEELFMTQPAVSIQLKKLQQQFDIPLFEVINRKTHITDFGHEVAKSAQKIIDEAELIRSKSLEFKGLTTGKLKIMSVSTGKYILPYLLGDFLTKHPGVELQMDVTNKQTVIQTLEENKIDFGLISILPNGMDLEYENLMENKLYLVGPKHNEPKYKKDPKKIFNEYPIIYRESGSATRTAMEEFLKENGIQSKAKLELTSNEAVKQAVIAGLGFSVMPQIGIQNELDQGKLSIIPVKGLPIISTWRIVWLKNKKLSPAANAYLSFIRKEKMKLQQSFFH